MGDSTVYNETNLKQSIMEYYTFEQLKEMAFKDGITGNKVAVGIWARMNGFLKKKKQINKRRITFYFKLDNWQHQNV